MSEEQYHNYTEGHKNEMILRDYLAVDRTIMANESSFLSYIRTSLTLVVAGVSLVKFLDSSFFHLLGWSLLVLAGLLVIHGAMRYEAMENILDNLTGEMKSNTNEVHAGLARRFLIASRSLIGLFR